MTYINLNCFLWGHKLKKSWNGYICKRCFAYTTYSPLASRAIEFLIAFIGAFAFIGITMLFFIANGLSLMKVPCCNSMYPLLMNNLNEDATNATESDFKPCWVINQAVNENDLKKGDVVAYKFKSNETILHRIIAECNDTSEMFYYLEGNKKYVIGEPIAGYVISGDNNPVPDPLCVPSWAIQGKFKHKVLCLAEYGE